MYVYVFKFLVQTRLLGFIYDDSWAGNGWIGLGLVWRAFSEEECKRVCIISIVLL